MESVRTEHARVLDELTRQHDADLKAKDDLFKTKEEALNAQFKSELAEAVQKEEAEAVKKAGADTVEAYKLSDEFQGSGLEYLERGVRTACRWVVLKFADVLSSIRPSLEAVELDDPLIAEALAQVEYQVSIEGIGTSKGRPALVTEVNVEGIGTSEDRPVLVTEETPLINVEAFPANTTQ